MYNSNDSVPDKSPPPTLIDYVDDFVPTALTRLGIDDDGKFLYVLILLLNRASGGIQPKILRQVTKWDLPRFASGIAQLIDTTLVLRRSGGLWCECLVSDPNFSDLDSESR